jgi:hypothetical protein
LKLLPTLLAGVLAFAPIAAAAQSVSVDINRAKLAWTWTAATGSGAPSEFRVKCGQSSGSYTKTTIVSDSALRSIDIKTVIGGQGNWFCVVSAANSFGESGNSNEVPFVAGAAPSGSIAASISAQ